MGNKFRDTPSPQPPPPGKRLPPANKFRDVQTPQPSPSQASRRAGPRNVFRELVGQQPAPKARAEEPQGDLGGYRGDKSGQLLPLTSAAVAEHVRWERGELTKDVGWSALGTPIGTIIGLFEHKWQFGGLLFARVLRIFNEGVATRSQYWDGYEWVESAQATEQMEDVYLSEVSIQGCLCLADGKRIMKWCEGTVTTEIDHDFTAGQYLAGGSGEECSEEVAVTPAGAVSNLYNVNLSVIFEAIPTDETVTVEVSILVNGIEAATQLVSYTPNSSGSFDPRIVPALMPYEEDYRILGWHPWGSTWPLLFTPQVLFYDESLDNDGWFDDIKTQESQVIRDLSVPLTRLLESGDTIQVCVGDGTDADVSISSLTIQLVDRSRSINRGPGNQPLPIWQWVGANTSRVAGGGDSVPCDYVFTFGYRVPPRTTLQLGFYIASLGDSSDVIVHLQQFKEYDNDSYSANLEVPNQQETFSVANVPAGAIFALYCDFLSNEGDGTYSYHPVEFLEFNEGPIMGHPQVEFDVSDAMGWAIHPYNYDSGDPRHGIEYDVVAGSSVTFSRLSNYAPGARYIFSFGDRLLALQDYGDRQSLAWSADGVITNWLAWGTEEWLAAATEDQLDAGQIWLLDAQIDPIDDLMAGAHIGGGNFALYRKRSIWRGFETGNVQQAIGVVPWIAGIGTEFRFSVQIIPGGNIFLGSDSMVYILTESGTLTPVGGPIIDEIRTRLTAEDIHVDYDLVDSLFDSWRQEYWLCIPEDEAEWVTAIWIFDLGKFMREEKIEWRKRPMPNGVRRLAAVTMLPEPLS